MKAVWALVSLCALSACARTAPEDAVFVLATQETRMPDCPSLHLNWAWQRKEANYYILAAQFSATKSCMRRWERNLADSDFEAQIPHGEWVKGAGWPTVLVSPPAGGGGLRGIMLPILKPIPGIEIAQAAAIQ